MVQVAADHYHAKYESPERLQLYYHVFKSVVDLAPRQVLEIGVGSGVVSHLLRQSGIAVTTADFDPAVHPDVVADIRSLPFQDGQFDVVIASQVLEHLPFPEVERALAELGRTSRRYCLVSVPFNRHNITLYGSIQIHRYLRFGGAINRFLDKYGRFHFNAGLPRSRKSFQPDGEHCWEIGYREYPLDRVRALFSRCGEIVQEFRVPLSPYHYVFLLKTGPAADA